MRWVIPPVDTQVVVAMSRELGVSLLLARLLVLRGIVESRAAEEFLRPSLRQLHDPFRMADMRIAVERLQRAIDRQERILIYGDYDVDGAMAVVVLLTTLKSLGAKVEAFIPDRLTDGYGLRVPVIERAAAQKFGVVLSVDTGIREHEVLARARELGVDCIVTDHHLPESHLPPACAILNPLRPDCAYPDKNLSGVGVAFKLVQALAGERLSERQLLSYLKIVAIGTIGDVVPLVGENRVIAHFGLEGLSRTASQGRGRSSGNPGLEAILEIAGLAERPVNTGDVGFRIAPRLNAAGRMENAREVIDLFTTPDPGKARSIAEHLDSLNRERQRVEEEILREIIHRVEQRPGMAERYSLIFSGEGWHRGVLGIVAQRVAEKYHRPALIIGIEDGIGQGSGRSIAGFHLLDALHHLGELFDRFGGHAQAAGFTVPANRLEELQSRFEAHAQAVLKRQDLEPVLRIDAELPLEQADWKVLEVLDRLEPYGMGNPRPVFAALGVRLAGPPRILKEKHLKIRVAHGPKVLDALAWGRALDAQWLVPGQLMDAAFTLEQNIFQESATLQLVMKDLRASPDDAASLRGPSVEQSR